MAKTEQKAFVLHSRPYQENQKIIDFLTEQNGKISVFVYVGQSKKSIKNALLQPFTPLLISLKEQAGHHKINSVSAYKKSYLLEKDALYSGFYLNELMLKLLGEHIACDALFSQYQQTIQALAQGLPIAEQLRNFEWALLEELGMSFDFSPVFDAPEDNFYYFPEQGFVSAQTTLNQACFNGRHLQVIAEQARMEPAEQHTFKILMREVLNHLLGNKPLNTRKLFKQMKY